MAVEVRVAPTRDDFDEALAARHKGGLRALRWLFFLAAVGIPAALIRTWPDVPRVGVWCITFPVALGGLFFLPRFLHRSAVAHLVEGWSRWKEATMIFDEAQVRLVNERSDVYRRWSMFGSWFETQRLIVLRGTDQLVCDVIPKSGISPGELPALRQLLDEAIELTPRNPEHVQRRASRIRVVLWIVVLVGFAFLYAFWRAAT